MKKVDGGGLRYNEGKNRLDLVPLNLILGRNSPVKLDETNEESIELIFNRACISWLQGTFKPHDVYHLGKMLECVGELLKRQYEYSSVESALEIEIGAVLTAGAKKYDDNNWRRGMKWSVCYGCIRRHFVNGYQQGKERDDETGLPHLAHVACNILFLMEYRTTCPELDNRYIIETKERSNEKCSD